MNYILKANKHQPELIIDSDFSELNFGEYEGDSGYMFWEKMGQKLHLDFNEIEKRSVFEKFDYLYHPNNNPTAERISNFKQRINNALENTIKIAKENNYKNIIILSHGVVVSGIIELIDKNAKDKHKIKSASVTKLTYSDGKYHIEYIGKKDNL